MKTIKLICLLGFLSLLLPIKSFCISCSIPDTITSYTTITSSCIINGDLVILNGGVLDIDFTSAAADTFVVRGNIFLKGNAILRIHAAPGSTGEQFIVSNSYSGHRTIRTNDSSKIMIEYVEFRTQEGDLTNAASIYMSYYAEDRSIVYINRSWLDRQKAWLLCDVKSKSTLIGYEPDGVPTEIYLQDSAQITLHGPNTNTGLWLKFESIIDTLTLPTDQTQPFNWKIGRGVGGLNTQWYLEIDTAKPGFGVQIFPTAKMLVNGVGFPAYGELSIALMFANGTDTIKDLKVGLQNSTVADGRLTLNNVNLTPVAWLLYPLMNETLYVKNSIVNEIGIAGPSIVIIDSSLLQLAVLGAVGIGGCTMTINNSEIWNQSITAANNSNIILNNCNVNGSAFSTTDTLSHITVNGGCFFQNPSGCTQNTMINITTGQPYCNPFMPPGFPQILTPATITLNGVNSNCIASVEYFKNSNKQILVYPNPTPGRLSVNNDGINIKAIEIYSSLGKGIYKSTNVPVNQSTIDLSNQPKGIYFVKIYMGEEIYSEKIVIQ